LVHVGLHGAIFQRVATLITTAVKTSDPSGWSVTMCFKHLPALPHFTKLITIWFDTSKNVEVPCSVLPTIFHSFSAGY
jgi:hypothetical protein